MNNCINCGAPIDGGTCQYCGTRYTENGFVCDMEKGDCTGTIKFDGKTYQVYLGHVEGNLVCGGASGRDASGRLHIDKPRIKRKFTLIEV